MIKLRAMRDVHFEIERKYLIRMPDLAWLTANAEGTEITQTYLLARPGTTERVRKRGRDGVFTYTHTTKTKLSDLRRIEDEEELTQEQYLRLLQRADPARNVIEKTRWCFRYEGQLFELDVFPFWADRAFLEIEIPDESQPVRLPPWLQLVREVSADPRYTNAALSLAVPQEDIGEESKP